jgi:DNA polymerase sigma
MPNPMMRIHDIETDEIIDREMTDEECAEFYKSIEPTQEELAKITAKAALLEKLGITQDEANLLLS